MPGRYNNRDWISRNWIIYCIRNIYNLYMYILFNDGIFHYERKLMELMDINKEKDNILSENNI